MYNCLSFIIAKILNILLFVKIYSFTKTITKTLLVNIYKNLNGIPKKKLTFIFWCNKKEKHLKS